MEGREERDHNDTIPCAGRLTMNQMRTAAAEYLAMGWVTTPLTNDANGLPKGPIVEGWQALTLDPDRIYAQPWDRALGIGVVLGPESDNLAVLDIDDHELGALCLEQAKNTRRIRTIRKRAHLYVTEAIPSSSSRFTLQWHGRDITIELKARGTQVAAPPTPGYEHVAEPSAAPLAVPTIAAAWQQLVDRLSLGRTTVLGNYPRPWEDVVPEGSRNNSAFVEAHRLREAGIPMDQAMDIMRFRWDSRYRGGQMPWREVERTVRSAYSKGLVEKVEGINEWVGILD